MADYVKFKPVAGWVFKEEKQKKQEEEQQVEQEQQVKQPEEQEALETTTPTINISERIRINREKLHSQNTPIPQTSQTQRGDIKGTEAYENAWLEYLKSNPDDFQYKPFLDHIAKVESNFQSVQNKANNPAYGYFQLWKTNIGDSNPQELLNDPLKQISLAIRLHKSNISTFTDYDYELAKQKGFTKNAMYAGAWLGGVGGVREFLNKGIDRSDRHLYDGKGGSTVGTYMRNFNYAKEGGVLNNLIPIKIGDNQYNVQVVKTKQDKEKGLSNISELPEDQGMLFIISDKDKDWENSITFVMDDTSIDLDIIYLNGDLKVVRKRTMEAFSKDVVYGEADYVLEVNANSNIKLGDELEFVTNEKLDNTMIVLGPDGETQMTLKGGERVMSIKDTKILIKFAKKSDVTNNDNDYKALGKRVFKFLDIQNSNEKEYIN